MKIEFPNALWLDALKNKLNSDKNYARIAHKWEGDIMFEILANGSLEKDTHLYLDLWHGSCRRAFVVEEDSQHPEPAFILSASFDVFIRILEGDLDPMQAMITRLLKIQGSMVTMMRNVPVILDFVRCSKEVSQPFLDESYSK